NVNGAQVVGGTIRVDHVAKYKKKEEGDDEEEEKRKRKEHGVYRASQIGECTRGAGCRFSHNEHMYVKIPALGDLDDVVIGVMGSLLSALTSRYDKPPSVTLGINDLRHK
nr:zinc finger CCCH domain-containing protein 25 [Tanacetum cinerariifolium]